MQDLYERATDLLGQAGVTIGGPAPTDIKILDERCLLEIFTRGRIAVGETYMWGWWEVEDLIGFTARLYEAGIQHSLTNLRSLVAGAVQAYVSYKQSRERNREVAIEHYNMLPRLFDIMLDKKWKMYSCGLFRTGANSIEDAQTAKCDLTARKLHLRGGQTLLDVGSGFTAGLLRFACEEYDVSGTGITNSENQEMLSTEAVAGMPIDIRFRDWRDIEGQYDRIASLGMFEHVGLGNYPAFFRKMRSLLKDDGLMLLHYIGASKPKYRGDPWLHKYIFPNGMLTSLSQVSRACEQEFVIEDVDNFGPDYGLTAAAWFDNLDEGWDELVPIYGTKKEPTFRMMKFYLHGVAGNFRARNAQLHQIVLSPKGMRGGYRPVR